MNRQNWFYIAAVAFIVWGCQQDKSTQLFELLDSDYTGITFQNIIIENDSFNILNEEYIYNGGGVGIADLNNDGLPDIVFAGNKAKSKIFLNQGQLRFLDITDSFEGLTDQQWISGIAVTDINQDGLIDLYFTSTMSPNRDLRKNQLWVNQGLSAEGIPSFKEEARAFGIDDDGFSMHAAFLDYDLDGDLDLYVLNNTVSEVIPTSYRRKINDGTSINQDQLYENMGDGTFRNMSAQAGITIEGFGLGIAVGDINKDGYPDIYISNDYISNDILYLNQKDGTFKDVAQKYFPYQSKFSMGNDMADVNNDGNLDILTMDMLPRDYARVKQTINGNSYFIYVHDKEYGYQPQFVRNMLHLHSGFVDDDMVPFSEVAQMMGIDATEWSWSPLFFDVDNDGDRDLLITNGFPKDLTDKDFTNFKAQMRGFLMTDFELSKEVPVVHLANFAFENINNESFVNRTADWGLDIRSFSNGAAFADLDNDGDLDYITNNINSPAFIYKNKARNQNSASNNYIGIILEGSKLNPLAIGTKISIWSSGQLQYAEQNLSRGYISSVDPRILFGLNDANIVDSIQVIWPDGLTNMIYNVNANQYLRIRKTDATKNLATNRASPIFTENQSGLSFEHIEEDQVDFFNMQRIVPHKQTQFGPKMVLADIIGTGEKELICTGNPMQPIAVYEKINGQWQSKEILGLTDSIKYAGSDIKASDIDQDGDIDIVIVSGPYQVNEDGEVLHYWLENAGDRFISHPIPAYNSYANVVLLEDFNQDGFEDLFIGSSSIPDSFPYAYDSYVLINNKGSFDQAQRIVVDAGIVHGAVTSDVDGDGWKDLVVASEWRSPQFFLNNGGQAFSGQNLNVKKMNGLWSSVYAQDLDQDGDDDFVFGNLGLNHRFNIQQGQPLRLYLIDIDDNGTLDPIITSYWQGDDDVMYEYPVNYWDELVAQSPFFRSRFKNYTSFSLGTIDSILTPDQKRASVVFEVDKTESGILWNEGGDFKWQAFEKSVQVAPITCVLSRDFDGDHRADLLLLGNDYTYDVSTGIYDSNRGILLKNQGDRSFDHIPNTESGLSIMGQVECVLGDENQIYIGINRDSLKVYSFEGS